MWSHEHALRQFEGGLSRELLHKLEERGLWMDRLRDMSATEIGAFLRHPAAGAAITDCLNSFPALHIEAQLQPITRYVNTLNFG